MTKGSVWRVLRLPGALKRRSVSRLMTGASRKRPRRPSVASKGVSFPTGPFFGEIQSPHHHHSLHPPGGRWTSARAVYDRTTCMFVCAINVEGFLEDIEIAGAPDRTPTGDLPLRRRTLYAAELREHIESLWRDYHDWYLISERTS